MRAGFAVPVRLSALATTLALLGGCATFSNDGGFNAVRSMTKERAGVAPQWQRDEGATGIVRERARELLAQPLTPDAAAELALLNNPGLQADFQELGIAEATLVQAGRLRNPLFAFSRLNLDHGVMIERALLFDIASVLTMSTAVQLGRQRFEQTQYRVAAEAVGVAADARRALFSAVAAEEIARYFEQVVAATDASSELARRMAEVGNFSRLAQMREQALHAEAVVQLARAKHRAMAERERLTRVLGLAAPDAFQLPERLPELPAKPLAPVDAQRLALDKRLDVTMARRGAETLASSLGLTRATRFVNVFELGYINESETGEPRANGFEIELAVPLFDWGSARVARAESMYRQALQRTAQIAVQARSEVRQSYSAYRTALDVARHLQNEVVPLRKRISDEMVLRYNGMLAGPFELLADVRQQVASVASAIEARRDFWTAETDLQLALTGRAPGALLPAAGEGGAPSPTSGSEAAGH